MRIEVMPGNETYRVSEELLNFLVGIWPTVITEVGTARDYQAHTDRQNM